MGPAFAGTTPNVSSQYRPGFVGWAKAHCAVPTTPAQHEDGGHASAYALRATSYGGQVAWPTLPDLLPTPRSDRAWAERRLRRRPVPRRISGLPRARIRL